MVEAIRDNTIKAITIFVEAEDPTIQELKLYDRTRKLKEIVKEANAKIYLTQKGLEELNSNPYYNDWTDMASKWKAKTNMYQIMYIKLYKRTLESKAAHGDGGAIKQLAELLAKLGQSPSTIALPEAPQLPPPRPTIGGGVKTRKKRRRRRKRRKILTKNNKNKN